ncbi:MAG: DUF4126 domain-containing protein [Porphyromonadaceae bacterium]|jgi:hypothetical protein|nr:DUF4126 domain-containing protein [Porphyromonadaceae bacterium]
MNTEIITAVALGIGLAASAGFRVFIPMLVASVAAHFNIIPLNESFAWLGSVPAMLSFGVATVVEILAYYIPFVDNLLDTVTTPLAVGAGTLLMISVLPVEGELMKWIMGFIVGGGAAATIQSGSVLSRFTSSKFTAGTANPVVSTGENVAAVGSSVSALFIPIIVAIIFILIAIVIFFKLFEWRKNKKKQNAG